MAHEEAQPARASASGSAEDGERAAHHLQTTAEVAAQHEEIVVFLVRAGATRDSAEDIASEAIIRMWLRLHEGLRPRSRTAYVRRIARNLLVDQIRREARDRLRADALAARTARASMLADEADAIVLAVAVEDARRKLPHRFQQVLLCTLDLGMSRADTAAVMGLATPGAAAVMAHRARKALIENLSNAAGPCGPTAGTV